MSIINIGKYLGSLGTLKDREIAMLYSSLNENLKRYFERKGAAVWSSPDMDTQGFEIREQQTQRSLAYVDVNTHAIKLPTDFSFCAPSVEEVVRNTVRDFPRLLVDERRKSEEAGREPLRSLPSKGDGC